MAKKLTGKKSTIKKIAKKIRRGEDRLSWRNSSHPLAVALRREAETQLDLATRAKVQPATISRVINGALPGFGPKAASRLLPHVRKWGVTLEDLVLVSREA
jgi:hypothetical protein